MRDDNDEFAAELSRSLEAAVYDIHVPTDTLVNGGVARGRRLRRRRRAAAGVLGVGAAGVVAAVAFTGGGLLVPGEETQRGNEASTVTIPDFAPVAGSKAAAMSGKEALQVLEGLLPPDASVSDRTWQDDDGGSESPSVYGSLQVRNGQEAAQVSVTVEERFFLSSPEVLDKKAASQRANGASSNEGEKSAPSKEEAKKSGGGEKKLQRASREELAAFYSCSARVTSDAACQARNLEDGSVLINYEEESKAFPQRVSDLLRPDGTRIVVVVASRTSDDSPLSLSPADLDRIVTSDRWTA